MRLVLRIIKWLAVVIGILVIVLFSLSHFLGNKVAEIFLRSLNNDISTKIEVREYNLSFLRRFPKASFELKDVIVWSSPTFDKSQFRNINTDTLLTAESALLEFSMTDILKENYKIDKITANKGRINLLSDSSANVNYEIYSDTGTGNESSEDFVINLDRINLSEIAVRYINTATVLDISGIITSGSFRSRIAGDEIDFLCNTDLIIQNFDLLSSPLKTNAQVTIDLNLHDSDSGITFRKGSMKLENFRFGLSGSISSSDIMDLKITGHDIDLKKVRKYLPPGFLEKYNEYSPWGTLKSECRIYGLISRQHNPVVELLFAIEKGGIRHSKSNTGVSDLSVAGRFTNGIKQAPETWIIDLEKVCFTIGSTPWSGTFRISDLTSPVVNLSFSGEIKPGELMSFYNVPEIASAGGSARLNLRLSGRITDSKKLSFSDILKLHPEADIAFNSFSLKHIDKKFSFDDVDGNIMLAKHAWAEDLVFSFLGHRFRVNGEFDNLPAWLAGSPVKMKIDADISAGKIDPVTIPGKSSGGSDAEKTAVTFPDGIEANIRFRTDRLDYRAFSAENIAGVLRYRRGLVDISDLTINALGGIVKGEFYISEAAGKAFLSHGNFNFGNIDITKTFNAFKNFGQDFLKAENIEGTLSGSLSLLLPLDSLFNPDIKSVTAEGKYIIENGALKNFEPVKELSGFIELSELENITFSRLENDLFIKNNYLAVPQMDIKSSAADFSVNGKHTFNNDYEYHVKVYLSEILSRKARKNSRYSTEFGPVEEDGLGRTSVFLKLSGNGTDVKVVPDLKASGNNIKQSLRKEKGTLKSILNEEYGWFQNDTAVKSGTASKPKYRIRFDDSDTVSVQKDTVSDEGNRGLNRIFRKKKGIFQEF